MTKTPARRLSADVGGTFPDVAAFDEESGELRLGKALSTPARLADGISHGVDKAAVRYRDASIFLHGSTIAINTLLERLPGLRLAAPASSLRWRTTPVLRGLEALPVRW